MSRSLDERTLQMRKAYMHLFFEEGLGPLDIAKQFKLSPWAVYNSLDSIAAENGLDRIDLLVQPEKSQARSWTRSIEPVEKIDTEEFTRHTTAAIGTVSKLNTEVAHHIEVCERSLKKFEEEMNSWN